MSDSSDEEPVAKRKRGIVHPEDYKRNIVREARVKGLGYVSHKGKDVAKKACPEDISCKCPKKCFLKLTNDQVKTVWNYFYKLESKDQQDIYLQAMVEAKPVVRRTVKRDEDDVVDEIRPEEEENGVANQVSFKRNHTFCYTLKIDGSFLPVCKSVFLKAHGITADRMKRICKLLLANESPRDLRGKNRSGNALPGHICVLIHDHIQSLDVKETHYGGRPKKYLDARLDVNKMHSLFLSKHPELENIVKYNFYYMYFKENFDYSFGRPQVDVCCTCESLGNKLRDPGMSDNAKRNVSAQLMIHKRRAKKFYNFMSEAGKDNDPETVAICFDFMQNLPLPHIPVQEVFYMRQLWVNNFCIHNLKTNDAKMYVYHEGVANKSPDEVCSFLFDYIKKEIPDNVKHLKLFSDGPYGQNKNHTVIRFLLSLCDNSHFESITYYFPVRGHSYSPCDRDFGCVKRIIRKVDRIYTPEQYKELILRSSKRERFSVHEVKTEDVLNFKKWWPTYYKKNTYSDATSGRNVPRQDKENFKISAYKQFKFSSTVRGKVVVSEFIDGITSSIFSLSKTNAAPPLPVEVAYLQGKVIIHFYTIFSLSKKRYIIILYL